MYYKNKLIIATLSLGLIVNLVSCGSGGEPEKKEEMKDTTVVSADSGKANKQEDEISYTLPSPMQIANIFKKSGLKYYSGMCNKTDEINKYKAGSLTVKALNLGVYSADLSYCILNKQNQESKNYFKSCKELASELGLAKAFDSKNAAQRMEKNMNNQDSLSAMLVDIQMETDNILNENNQEHISVISFTGAWIESMYIGVQVNGKEKNTNIAAKLVEQMAIAENIIKALKAHSAKDAGIGGLIKQMTTLSDIYNNFKSVKEIKATDPDVIDPAKLNISITELYSFSQKLEEIRSAIIKG
ncbi:MAG TPA: hypothetical protein VNZ49_13030 [Bacteroidia bacterium]|jgi:hypothetical protein|nr:hypothetical protein [Bacteroidia bacterium]